MQRTYIFKLDLEHLDVIDVVSFILKTVFADKIYFTAGPVDNLVKGGRETAFQVFVQVCNRWADGRLGFIGSLEWCIPCRRGRSHACEDKSYEETGGPRQPHYSKGSKSVFSRVCGVFQCLREGGGRRKVRPHGPWEVR